MFHEGAHWRNLANTTEPSMCGGDAAFLSNYFDQLFVIIIINVILAICTRDIMRGEVNANIPCEFTVDGLFHSLCTNLFYVNPHYVH